MLNILLCLEKQSFPECYRTNPTKATKMMRDIW